MLQIPGATSYIGCIGKDKFGDEMKKNSKLSGVDESFFFFTLNSFCSHKNNMILFVLIVFPL